MPRKEAELPKEFVEKCKAVTDKRPKTVIDHILKNGFITTEELKDLYGYNHPPRAARDVREQGIPLVTYRVEGGDGRSIGAYKFGDVATARFSKLSGRSAFEKGLKEKLIKANGSKCAIYLEEVDEKLLQIDHRVPYEVDGDGDDASDVECYMLLCSSANRAKSWACEHCANWLGAKDKKVCLTCYWASPENYRHVAGEEIRRVDLMWLKAEVEDFEKLKAQANAAKQDLPKYAKELLKKAL